MDHPCVTTLLTYRRWRVPESTLPGIGKLLSDARQATSVLEGAGALPVRVTRLGDSFHFESNFQSFDREFLNSGVKCVHVATPSIWLGGCNELPNACTLSMSIDAGLITCRAGPRAICLGRSAVGPLTLFLAVEVVFFLLSWLIPMPLVLGPIHMQLNPDGIGAGSVSGLSLSQKVAGILIGLPGLVALTYGVVRLGKTLIQFQQGQIFAARTIAHLRASAGAIFLAIMLFTLEKPLRALAFNALGTGKTYPVSMDVTSNELLLILVCSLFYLIAGVMHEGRRLSEENEGFI